MAHEQYEQWDDDDRQYSSSKDSDDSPILSYRYEKYRRYAAYTECREDRDTRSTLTVLAKFFLFSTAMILFCVLIYIPMYTKVNDQVPKAMVSGWSANTNRDTKIYIQPNNITTLRQPSNVCTKETANQKLFLLIIVCSATDNFEQRIAIRETWGDNIKYLEIERIFQTVRERYKNYNFTHDLCDATCFNNTRIRRDLSYAKMLPELAKALKDTSTNQNEKRENDSAEMIPEFDMNEQLNEIDYGDYESNVMKIPPKGVTTSDDVLKNVQSMFKKPEIMPDFKLVFLMGLPTQNESDVQAKIDEEQSKYGDLIQESFLDTYNNLTLKSIMMLKWVVNNCNDSVRYILKTDDDMYVNLPNLISNLRNRSRHHDNTSQGKPEYLLMGNRISGAKPVQDTRDKWYSPRYMYSGRVYPRYLSGTAYVLSTPAVPPLYRAALATPYFHLEDIYVTGMCAVRASPRIVPRDEPLFSYHYDSRDSCRPHTKATLHRVPPTKAREIYRDMFVEKIVDQCERLRLTQVRQERLRPKHPKRKSKGVPKRRT